MIEIATIVNGKVVAKGIGQCVLTATVGNYTTKCNIIVSEYSALKSIAFDYSEKNAVVNEEFEISISAINVSLDEIEVLSSDGQVVSVTKINDKIIAKALKLGVSNITAKTAEVSAICKVSVYSDKAQRLDKPRVQVDGTTVSFSKPDNVDGVYYRVNNSVWKKTDQAFTINTFIPVAQSLLVEIKAYSNDMNYFESDIVKTQIYGELFVHGGKDLVEWKPLTGATTYDVYVDGKLVSENQTACSFDQVNQDDFYQVKVVADNGTESNDCLYFRKANSVSKIYDMSKKPKLFNYQNHSCSYRTEDEADVMTINAALGWGWNRRFGIYVGNGKVEAGDKLNFYAKISDFTLQVKTGEEGEGENKKDIREKVSIPHLSKYVSTTGTDIYSCGYHTATSRRTDLVEGWVKNVVNVEEKFLQDTDGDGTTDTINVGYMALFEYIKLKDKDGNELDAEKLLNLIKQDIEVGFTTAEDIYSKGWLEYKLHISNIYLTKELVNAINLDNEIIAMSNSLAINDLKADDYYRINTLCKKYQNLTLEEKENVNNLVLLESYYQAYTAKYDVKVIFDGKNYSDLTILASGDGATPSAENINIVQTSDSVVGDFIKVNYGKESNKAYFMIEVDRSDIKDYDIYWQTKGVYEGPPGDWSDGYLSERTGTIRWAYEALNSNNWGVVQQWFAYMPEGTTSYECTANTWVSTHVPASVIGTADTIYLGFSIYTLANHYACVSPIVAIKAK